MIARGFWSIAIGGALLLVAVLWTAAGRSSTEVCDIGLPDFVRVAGVTYERVTDASGSRVSEAERGPVYATVERSAVAVAGCDYRPRDGDASLLPVGTPLYAFSGQAPTSRLAAYADDATLALYRSVASGDGGVSRWRNDPANGARYDAVLARLAVERAARAV